VARMPGRACSTHLLIAILPLEQDPHSEAAERAESVPERGILKSPSSESFNALASAGGHAVSVGTASPNWQS
jgi:hypothetical protein